MNFTAFIEFLNSLYIEEVERASRVNNQERIARMVFTGDFNDDVENFGQESNRRQAMRTARCVKILGKGVVKVVHRCDQAKENNTLDLSDCQLMQMPDAVYHLMRNTPLVTCNLSSNVIAKIPPKFPLSFSLITELDLSNNRISALPQEMVNCSQLEIINISSNSFVILPHVLLDIPSLAKINAGKNFIADVDVEAVVSCGNIEQLNLEGNPLNPTTHQQLQDIQSIRITLSPRQREEWEDLSI
ncbi:leucine-rich repeat-containing protein 20 [Eurytemora carolleeae]|uniref:leucine-rich repeat-containing protein 20 n=1 Tax=Eurytemora carolleeae TaxID=1294199 RepID=UPI000C77FD3C|nr:leucine-rich repeat-containing protein 20 [Eurytemora carolleeae]|eukprot:XP_023324553.1 leucine-rich repeat-containing protein 20-like [Eurytemora affinis]